MTAKIKNKQAILNKLGIQELNVMQQEAHVAISNHDEVVLLSPTGTGKTLAFLLPIIATLDPELQQTQALILVPSRELAIQIDQVIREMGSGFKTNAVYGGKAGFKDRMELKHPPAILIGTPGRVADHFRRETISISHIKTLILDEFDKSLEVGFASEMRDIMKTLPALRKKILTSATQRIKIPEFVGIRDAKYLKFLGETIQQLQLKTVVSEAQDKLDTLVQLLKYLGNKNGIVFCNLKDSIQDVSDYLFEHQIDHACFYGGLDQAERERALIKFRNGTHRTLIATDLAARGLDIPEMDYIIHYELPFKEAEFVHRNGRTARMRSEGTAYLLKWKNQSLPGFIKNSEELIVEASSQPISSLWETLFISGGRKDKISKSDIAGLFFKQGGLKKEELGVIELKQDMAFVSVPRSKSDLLIKKLNNSRLKKKKVRISILT